MGMTMKKPNIRRSWVEVNLDILAENLRIYRQSMQGDHPIMAVVKANAYGHGDLAVAGRLQSEGVRDFAVSNLAEAIRLRQGGIAGQILILGYTPVELAKDLLEYDITQAILDEDYAAALAATGVKTKAQFAIDTGMNRIGLDALEPGDCERTIRKYSGAFALTGLFTHLCVADTDDTDCRVFTALQQALVRAGAERVGDLHLPFVHCLNSAGGLWHGQADGLVRLGIILYGLKPDYANDLPAGIRPALEWKTVVSMVKTVHPGETVGYGRTYRADADRVIATLPTGYADGYNRLLSNCGQVLINGQSAPIIGRVCMDQMMVDVTGIDGVRPGDEVTLLNHDTYTADDMAETIGTIGYEIVCDISARVERVYLP